MSNAWASRVTDACATASSLCSLPAVATLDWCDRAAGALIGLIGHSVVAVCLAELDEEGRSLGPVYPGIAKGEGHAMIESSALRARLSALPAFPISKPGSIVSARLEDLDPRWREGELAAACSVVPLHDLLVGAARIPRDSRTIVVIVVPLDPARTVTDIDIRLLESVLPILAAKAALVWNESSPGTWLTQREQEILEHLVLGMSVREIAQTLRRSPHTVHDHVKSLHRKLGAKTRGELIARALGHPTAHTPVEHPIRVAHRSVESSAENGTFGHGSEAVRHHPCAFDEATGVRVGE